MLDVAPAPPPPLHAINRGLGTEGLGTVLAGLWGSGNGTNTFGENVGAIGVTKVGSRRVVQWAAGLMVLQGVVGKLGAVFIIIPQPIVGGLFCVMFGMISAFGLSALQYVDLNSSRNLYIIGFSLFFPLVLTRWMAAHSGVIDTGVEALDAVLQVLLSTSILAQWRSVGWRRGLRRWRWTRRGATEGGDTYDFPYGMSYIHRWKWTSYLPFMPTYESGKFTALFKKKERSILRVFWPKTIRNEDLWKLCRQSPIGKEIAKRKWRWIGHTVRRGATNAATIAFDWRPPNGKRSRGRPVQTWRRSVENELRAAGLSWSEAKSTAEDRRKWRTLVETLCTSGVP
ncbi:unnamed protein product [Plutella xylostella]|uniref:(diamondback moth) hypothetical protein n=1 Tax=Plutella xylostella TaxID=51655 RepID=A0A8S4G0J3_PLUXY|nr:unnamed protein product [Plutella xylostella]